jgi:hypothetical protein
VEYKGPVITFWFLVDLLLDSGPGNLAVIVVFGNIFWLLILRAVLLNGSLPFKTLTLPSFFVLAYCGLMLVPSAIWFSYYESRVALECFSVIQLAPTFFILGVFVANQYARPAESIISGFFATDIYSAKWLNRGSLIFFVLASVIELTIAAAYVASADVVPLFHIFQKGRLQGDEVRFAIYASGPLIIFLYAFAVRVLVPFTVLYPLYMRQRYGRIWSIIFWLALSVGLGICLLTLERQSSLSLLCLLILSLYFLQGQHLGMRQFVIMAVILTLLGGFVSLAQFGHELNIRAVAERAISYLVMRLLLDPSYMTYIIFEKYAETPLLFGATIRILSFLGVQYEHVTAIGFLADLWVNYGWVGVVLGPVILGFVLQYIQLHFFIARNIPAMIIYSVMMLSAGWLIFSNMLPTMVVSVYVVGAIVLGRLNHLRRSALRMRAPGMVSSEVVPSSHSTAATGQ